MTELKIPPATRCMRAEEVRALDDALEFAFSSEYPVERGWGIEVLDHSPGAMDSGRIERGAAPLLWQHDPGSPIGVVERAWTDSTKRRGMARVKFFATEKAREVRSMVEGGLRNVSFGYRVLELEEARAGGGEYRATRWEPFEVSFVSIPADPTVGLGRAHELEPTTARVRAFTIPADAADTTEEATMAADTAADKPATPYVTVSDNAGADLERLRIEKLDELADVYGVPKDIARAWRSNGVSIAEATRQTLSMITERTKATNSVAHLDMPEKEVRQYSLLRAINAVVHKSWDKAGLEMEAHQAIQARTGKVLSEHSFYVPLDVQARDLSVGASGGDKLVATDKMGFIELLRNRSVVLNMGATRMSGLTGNVSIPKQTAAATAYWLTNETTGATESQPTINHVTLSPKNVAAYTEVSRQLMLQSSPSAESIVMTDLAAVVALAVDTAALNGDGLNGAPTGILQTNGIGSVTGTDLGYAGIIELQTDVASANVIPTAGGYVTTPAVAGKLKQRARFNGTDTPLWQGNIYDGTVEGFRAMSSLQMPSATMLYGDFASCIVGEWGVLEIDVNPYASFAAGIVGVRAFYTCDVALRFAGAFSAAGTIT